MPFTVAMEKVLQTEVDRPAISTFWAEYCRQGGPGSQGHAFALQQGVDPKGV
jgi:hypothetical protein